MHGELVDGISDININTKFTGPPECLAINVQDMVNKNRNGTISRYTTHYQWNDSSENTRFYKNLKR